jgi:hypothetical protein
MTIMQCLAAGLGIGAGASVGFWALHAARNFLRGLFMGLDEEEDEKK